MPNPSIDVSAIDSITNYRENWNMTADKTQAQIIEILQRIICDKGIAPPPLNAETILLQAELPIDSLDLARLVVELEGQTGMDPFANGFIDFRTIGELARLFE